MFSLTQNYLTRGFWGDEAWTSLISQLPFLQMLKTTAADFHPPGYYTVVELWYQIFPATEVSTRIVSIIFYLLTVFLVYKLATFINQPSVIPAKAGIENARLDPRIREDDKKKNENDNNKKRLFGLNLFGLLSAIVVLTNPIFFTYAFEARNYTMFAFAATGSMYFLIRLLKNSTPEESKATSEVKAQNHLGGEWGRLATGFILFSTLGIYTHYYMFFTLAAQGLYILIFERKILLKMLGLYALVAVLYLPWIPFLASQVSTVGQDYWIGTVDRRTHFEALLRILGGEQQSIFRPWLLGLSIFLIIVGLIQHLAQKSFEKPYILIWLWATVPFIVATLPGLRIGGLQLPFRPIFFWRYLIGASVPLSMVLVHAAQKSPKIFFRGFIAVIIVLSLTIDWLTFWRYPYTFRQVYKDEVLPQINPSDRIVTVLPSFAEVAYYRNRNHLDNELIILPEGLVQFSGKSLLDAYVENGVVKIADKPESGYFEARPGPSIRRME